MSQTGSINEKFPKEQRLVCNLTAENKFSTSISSTTSDSTGTTGVYLYGPFTFELSGTWSATVTVQRSSDLGVTWVDVTSGNGSSAAVIAFTANGIFNGFECSRTILYRFGVKTGGFTSGTVVGKLEQ